jgi:predicted deacylase
VLYDDYLRRFRLHESVAAISSYGTVVEGGREYPLLRVDVPGPRTLLVTSGFHGEEQAGPLTLLAHLPEIVDHARSRGVGLRLYPCINPSGFEAGTRYNRSGEGPNNDFLRYEVAPGRWAGELRPGQPFRTWAEFAEGPRETRALRKDLAGMPTPVAALDIHQDRYLAGAYHYAYVFGDPEDYRPLVDACREQAAVPAGYAVDEWHRTGEDGLIEFHDGSITDLFYRRGSRYLAALETTTGTPPEICDAVNRRWIRGFVELAARS